MANPIPIPGIAMTGEEITARIIPAYPMKGGEVTVWAEVNGTYNISISGPLPVQQKMLYPVPKIAAQYGYISIEVDGVLLVDWKETGSLYSMKALGYDESWPIISFTVDSPPAKFTIKISYNYTLPKYSPWWANGYYYMFFYPYASYRYVGFSPHNPYPANITVLIFKKGLEGDFCPSKDRIGVYLVPSDGPLETPEYTITEVMDGGWPWWKVNYIEADSFGYEDFLVTIKKPFIIPPDVRKAVGGIWVPVDKLALLSPYIALASTILVATVATAVYVKRVKRRKEKQ
jgi:hypothetical protein